MSSIIESVKIKDTRNLGKVRLNTLIMGTMFEYESTQYLLIKPNGYYIERNNFDNDYSLVVDLETFEITEIHGSNLVLPVSAEIIIK
jgi:hypothetical protein